jgi:hypothetical protein
VPQDPQRQLNGDSDDGDSEDESIVHESVQSQLLPPKRPPLMSSAPLGLLGVPVVELGWRESLQLGESFRECHADCFPCLIIQGMIAVDGVEHLISSLKERVGKGLLQRPTLSR